MKCNVSKDNDIHQLAVDCIYQALVQLMETKPYEDITITDITKKAGVSRMAYYRNYREKDDILIDHLKKTLKNAESGVSVRSNLAQKDFWKERIRMRQKDPINELLLRAGLLDKAFKIHLDFFTRLYKTYYKQEELDEHATIRMYSKLGALYGCMIYLIEHKESMSTDAFAEHLMALAEAAE